MVCKQLLFYTFGRQGIPLALIQCVSAHLASPSPHSLCFMFAPSRPEWNIWLILVKDEVDNSAAVGRNTTSRCWKSLSTSEKLQKHSILSHEDQFTWADHSIDPLLPCRHSCITLYSDIQFQSFTVLFWSPPTSNNKKVFSLQAALWSPANLSFCLPAI